MTASSDGAASGPYYADGTVTLHHGDALDVARTLPTAAAQTIVTSPPYFGLRDYGEDGQIGAETTPAEYVEHLVELFRELRRVLANDGTLWLNLGDSYADDTKWGGSTGGKHANGLHGGQIGRAKRATGLPGKNLIGIPWRVAFALQDDGWILRSDIVWAKPNPMPESVVDRPTKAHEYLFLLTKQPRYYYDAASIKERDSGVPSGNGFARPQRLSGDLANGSDERWLPGGGRNKRDVWFVPTVAFPAAHFATYPPDLIRPCVLAGSRPGDLVLDPFSGSGTTGMVATYEGRRYLGIDINAEYLDLSLRTRFAAPTLGIETAS